MTHQPDDFNPLRLTAGIAHAAFAIIKLSSALLASYFVSVILTDCEGAVDSGFS